MYIKTLEISNFRSIGEKLIINFSENKTVFVGKNNSGKSNILAALDILFGEKYPYYYNITEEDFNDKEKDIEIECVVSDIKKEQRDMLKYKGKSATTDKGRITSSGELLKLKFTSSFEDGKYFDIITEKAPPNCKAGFQSKNKEFLDSLATFIYVPADRNINNDLRSTSYSWYGKLLNLILQNQNETQDYKNLETKLDEISEDLKKLISVEKIKDFSKTLTYIEDIKFALSETNRPEDLLKKIEILAKDQGVNDFLHISKFGTGTQSAIILGLFEVYLHTLSENNNSALKIFVIDEPENFLHPQAKRLINTLFENLSKQGNTQVVYSTHSSELVSCFQEEGFHLSDVKLIQKNNDFQTKVIEFDQGDDKNFSKVVENLNGDNAEVFFADKVLLVEGETEKHSISNIFQFYNWQESDLNEKQKEDYKKYNTEEEKNFIKKTFNLDYQNISVIEVGGKGDFPKWFKFCYQLLGENRVFVLHDKDSDFETNDKPKIISCINEVFDQNFQKNDFNDFEKYGWLILEKGEFENYYKKEKIKNLLFAVIKKDCEKILEETRQTIIDEKEERLNGEIGNLNNAVKISDEYEKIFKKYLKGYTKPSIAFKLSKWLVENDGYEEDLIKVLKKII